MSKTDDVLVAMRRVIRATYLHSRHLVKTSGLTAPQILVLQAINEHQPVTIGQIAGHVSLSQATVTTIIDRLSVKELVYRERSSHDRRKVHAFLTEKGCAVLEQAPRPLQDKFAERFDALDDWEQSMILASLQRVATMMDAQDLDAAPLLDVGQAPDATSITADAPESQVQPTQVASNN